ncbi:MAG TPA: SCO family protein [Bryobacteraceae bacterium]|jgi:protein SCO1/2|nr:SCO family protein [Bryobacteraceae bacterium]
MKFLLTAILAASLMAQTASKTAYKPAVLRNVGIDQKMGAQVPLDIPFVDEDGRQTSLRQFTGKPIVLALVYYSCPSLCNMVLNGVVRSAKELKMTAGGEFNIVAVSFDPRETPEMAKAKKASYVREYNRSGGEKGFHFLTGEEASSRSLADAVGFHYAYDSVSNQYAHASAILILTPEGRVARYFYGIDYPSRDLRFGIEEASGGKISTPVDAVLLYCYHYDPSNGKYGLVIMNALRIGGGLTLAVLLGFMAIMLRRDFRAAHPPAHPRTS